MRKKFYSENLRGRGLDLTGSEVNRVGGCGLDSFGSG
jgi:hypothetical protein